MDKVLWKRFDDIRLWVRLMRRSEPIFDVKTTLQSANLVNKYLIQKSKGGLLLMCTRNSPIYTSEDAT